MIARLGAPGVATKGNHLALLAIVASAALFASVRFFEDPTNPATLARALASALAIACVCLARRQPLLNRAAIFVALESIGGVVAFAFVDVPFIENHREQIGQLALTVYTVMHPH